MIIKCSILIMSSYVLDMNTNTYTNILMIFAHTKLRFCKAVCKAEFCLSKQVLHVELHLKNCIESQAKYAACGPGFICSLLCIFCLKYGTYLYTSILYSILVIIGITDHCSSLDRIKCAYIEHLNKMTLVSFVKTIQLANMIQPFC